MIDIHCYRCRKLLLKSKAITYSHANDSLDGEQEIQCRKCGWHNWFRDYRLTSVVELSAIGSSATRI